MMTKVKIMATDGETTVQSVSPNVKKNQIQNSPRIWMGKGVLIRTAVEDEDNENRIADETANTSMAFQPPAISLPYTAQKSEKRKIVTRISSNPSDLYIRPSF